MSHVTDSEHAAWLRQLARHWTTVNGPDMVIRPEHIAAVKRAVEVLDADSDELERLVQDGREAHRDVLDRLADS